MEIKDGEVEEGMRNLWIVEHEYDRLKRREAGRNNVNEERAR